jgi:hypothetical protein
MLRQYSFLFIFVFSLGALSAWSNSLLPQSHLDALAIPAHENEVGPVQASSRLELLETLDHLVAYEQYYRTVYGHFTKLLGRVGVGVSKQVAELYDIRVEEASPYRLLITAISEVDGRTVDRVTVDAQYRLTANFPLPTPRPEYLKIQALKHLRTLKENPANSEEAGIFKGYFRYETRSTGEERQVLALGIRPPVLGLQLEYGSGDMQKLEQELALLENMGDVDMDSSKTGQRATGQVMSTLEEAYLAQKIFRGEMGRYAKNWSELSKIAAFRFEEKERLGSRSVPFGDSAEAQPIDLGQEIEIVEENSGSGLVIEPLRGPAQTH